MLLFLTNLFGHIAANIVNFSKTKGNSLGCKAVSFGEIISGSDNLIARLIRCYIKAAQLQLDIYLLQVIQLLVVLFLVKPL